MGDSGEGLVDAESRIQERMEELQRSREQARRPAVANPEHVRKLESLKLARTEMSRQHDASTQPLRKKQLAEAVAEIDRRIAEMENSPA
jgi:uncharacterized membrane protein (DUF106 family)